MRPRASSCASSPTTPAPVSCVTPTPATSARSTSRASAASIFRCAPSVRIGRLARTPGLAGRQAYDVLIEVEDGRIKAVTEEVPAPAGAVQLRGWTIPGLANAHSHAPVSYTH